MRILVTGANGYLGQGIVKAIIESGNKVIATDFKLDNVDTRATKIECDIFSIEDPYEYFEKPDALLHLAWRDQGPPLHLLWCHYGKPDARIP